MSRRIVATGVVAALAASFAPTGLPEVAGAATDVPGTVTEVSWQTNLPEEIGDVAAGGPGALAVQSHGVIAIDGTTGEQVWQYETGGAQAVTLLATPDGGTALLVTSSDGELAMVALDAATGEERFVTPYVQTELASPATRISVTNDAFVLVAGSDSVRGYSLDDGTELWEAALPADCPGIAGWFGIDQATPSGVVVPCGGGWIPSSASQGGFAFLDTRRGEFTWTDVRDGLVGDTLSPPDVSPDGLLVRVRFWEHGANSGLAVADAILDVETGASLAEAERILGRLGYGGTVLHTGEITASARVRFENLRTGQQATMDVPCTVANPVVALSGGVLWLKFNRVIGEEPGDDPCQFVFTDAATGWTSAFSVEFEFTRQPQVVVRAGTIMFADGMTVFGLR